MSLVAPQPRYRQLAQTLISDIQAGRYPVGSLMPTETKLCEHFGASRFTVREAMRQLVQMGLVARKTGVGTKVQATASETVYRQNLERLADLYQYSADTHLEVLRKKRTAIDDRQARLLRAKPGEMWLCAEALRHVDGAAEPICFTELFIHPAFSTLTGLDHKVSAPVYMLIERQFGEQVIEVQQEISATILAKRTARLLRSKPGCPALLISRHYLNRRGEVIELGVSIHPADRFAYAQSFKRGWRSSE